jgi:6-phosphogluconate dehydrogenase
MLKNVIEIYRIFCWLPSIRQLHRIDCKAKTAVDANHTPDTLYFDACATDTLRAKVTEQLRDFFGPYTDERVDRPGRLHTIWE